MEPHIKKNYWDTMQNQKIYRFTCGECDYSKTLGFSEDENVLDFIDKHEWELTSICGEYVDIICDRHHEVKGCRNIFCKCRKQS